MDGNLEFRVLLFYFGILYLFPVVYWRNTRRSPSVVGLRGERQNRARIVATAFFVLPLLNVLIDGPWPWYPGLGLPVIIRWFAALPATVAILLLFWACRQTDGPPEGPRDDAGKWFVSTGPYRLLRHPQLLASAVFFLSMALLTNNGVVLIATLLGVLLLRLVVAPAVDADLEAEFGADYATYRQRTGGFLLQMRRVPKAKYAVPRRFGLFPVLVLTTIFAILFGALNYMRADPIVYLFVATEISAICLVQIIFGSAARSGSAVMGAILLPFWMAISLASERHRIATLEMIVGGLFMVVLGALLGYCIGALAAGFFLAMDMLEPYVRGEKPLATNATTGTPDQPLE